METMDLALRTAFNLDELEALFKFIPSTQLLKLRQVYEDWEEVAERVLRKRRDVELLLTTDNLDGRTNWGFFLFLNDYPKSGFVAPVIHIKNKNKSDQVLEEGRICATFQIIREICKQLGNRGIVKKLIIEDGDNAPHFTLDFVFALLSQLSSLETLVISKLQLTSSTSEQNPKFKLPSLKQIDFGYKYNDCDVKEARNLLKAIIESSPQLENISSSSECHNKIRELRGLDVIPMLRDAKHLFKMKEIVITKAADLEILLQCQPKMALQSLEIETEEKDVVYSKKLFTFLQQQADNLKSFKCGNSLVPKPIFTLPVLPLLEKLTFEPWNSGCLLAVNYGKQTPALKSLRITSTEASFQSWEEFLFYEISSEMPPCLSLEEMDVYISDDVQSGRTNKKLFDNWKNLFPNVTKLRFGNPEQFDMERFGKYWPKLETLTLEFGSNDEEENADMDELLFGISPNWKKMIDTTEEEWWMEIPAHEINAPVANFKSLKELKIEICFEGTVTLTDFSVYFGLRHLENLRKLEIILDPEQEAEIEGFGLSTEAFNFLVKNLPKLEKLNIAGQKWERKEILK